MARDPAHAVTSPAIATGEALPRVRGIPSDSDLALLELGLIAKSVCSGLYVSGRTLEDILAGSVRTELSDGMDVALDLSIEGQVTAYAGGLSRAAIHIGDQGCVLLPVGAKEVFFRPREIGLAHRRQFPFETAPAKAFEAAAAKAFSNTPDTQTAAVAILHRGKLVAERYGAGADAQMPLESWSMGKSVVALLIACAVADGLLALDEPIGLREWPAGDPRHAITFADALRMSSGLDFSAAWAEDYNPARHGYPDHGFIYSGAIDIRALTTSRQLAHAPGTFGAYKNGDTLLLLAALEDRLTASGLDPLTWPHERLLGPAGAGGIVLETDPYGHIFGTGNVYGRARDWLALAALFLPNGEDSPVKIDRSVLDFCSRPAPAWTGKYWMAEAPEAFEDSIYGGHVWLNRHAPADRWPAPEDALFFLGVGGQYTFAVPSLDLAIVRLGHIRGTTETGAGRGHVPALLEAACMAAGRSG